MTTALDREEVCLQTGSLIFHHRPATEPHLSRPPQVPHYSLTVQAADEGDPPLSSAILVTITVADVNDNPPVFSRVNHSLLLQVRVRTAYAELGSILIWAFKSVTNSKRLLRAETSSRVCSLKDDAWVSLFFLWRLQHIRGQSSPCTCTGKFCQASTAKLFTAAKYPAVAATEDSHK